MNNKKIDLIIKNIELLLCQLKLEVEDNQKETSLPENVIHISDILRPEDYEEPEYFEESDEDLPKVSVKWRNKNV